MGLIHQERGNHHRAEPATVPVGRYVDGAYYCLERSRGEHRHAGWGRKAA
jgi:hypothetical protein